MENNSYLVDPYCFYQWHSFSENQPTLLLLHGFLGSSLDYTSFIPQLGKYFNLLAIDLPGHGQTKVNDNDPKYYQIETIADGIIRLLSYQNLEQIWLFGYSMGGRLALYLATYYPDRFTALILESTHPGLSNNHEKKQRYQQELKVYQKIINTPLSIFLDEWYSQPIFQGIKEHPDYPSMISDRLNNCQDQLSKIYLHLRLSKQPFLGDFFTKHHLPILLISGEIDHKFVTINQTIKNLHPHINLHIIPQSSHNVHFQQPKRWTDSIVNFYHKYAL